MSIDGLLDAIDTYNAAILATSKRTGVPVVDDRTAVPPTATHFINCVHMPDAGSRIMAQRFADFLRKNNLLTPPAGSTGHSEHTQTP